MIGLVAQSRMIVMSANLVLLVGLLSQPCQAIEPAGTIEGTVGTYCTDLTGAITGGFDFIEEVRRDFPVPAGVRIGKIHNTHLPVFDLSDPRENNWLYRWANKFHADTKAKVINNQLLIKTDDIYEDRLLKETARILRHQKYLYDVILRPVRRCNESAIAQGLATVDVEVVTRDVWSFTPEVSFKRSGGENTFRLSLRDTNVFGSGQEVGASIRKDLERTSNEFKYKNNNLNGSRVAGRVLFADNDDGYKQSLRLHLPFYSLDTTASWRVQAIRSKQTDTQSFQGASVTEVTHKSEDYIAEFGRSKGLSSGVARRWTLGYRYQNDQFGNGVELPSPDHFPANKTLSYPFLGYAATVDNYTTGFNFDQILRTEDIHVGYDLFTRFGFASTALGSDADRIVVDGRFTDTLYYNTDSWWRHELDWRGLWNLDSGKSEDLIVDYEMRYFRNQTKQRSFVASFSAKFANNLNTNQQIVLGGDTGARAFPNRFMTGNRMVLLSLEERRYTHFHLFNLVRLGWAIFIDAGKVWKAETDSHLSDEYLADFGFGLRLSSTKSNSGKIVHIDFSRPLTNRDHPSVAGSQISVSLKERF
jgi:outer membrane protein assembly factor BamA